MREVHVSVGAGFENDRRDLGVTAARALSGLTGSKYLIFECLAERTLALQVQKNDTAAQIALALSYVRPCWELCQAHGIRIVSNFGGFDPSAVAAGLRAELGTGARIAAVLGDSVPTNETDGADVISKNVYLGAAGIVDALQDGAQIVVTGRVADPSLVVGPTVHELGLRWDDWDALANATMAGHLIECGTQVTGGYFADLDQNVPALEAVGPPVATITKDRVKLSKPSGGGALNRATVAQQLLYEVGDPAAYLTPDVILDLSQVRITDTGSNIVILDHAKGHPAPETLKMLVCRNTGWMGEAEISYAGETAARRGQLARDVLKARLGTPDMRIELLEGATDGIPCARLRLAIRSDNHAEVQTAINEVEALYLNGPAGGGGVRKSITPLIETEASLVPRSQLASPKVEVAS